MTKKSYLHLLSAKELKKFYSEEFLEGNSHMKAKLMALIILIVVGDLILNNFVPSPFKSKSTFLLVSNFFGPVAYVLYMVSYSGCLRRRSYKIRLILNSIALLAVAIQLVIGSYLRTVQAFKVNGEMAWMIAQLIILQSIHILALIVLLTPLWFLKVLVGSSYFLGVGIAYFRTHNNYEYWVLARFLGSFLFLAATTYLAWSFKYQSFVEKANIESWNRVYLDILQTSPGCIAVINIDGTIAFSNQQFDKVTDKNHKNFFSQFTKLRIRNPSNDLIMTNQTSLTKRDHENTPLRISSPRSGFEMIRHLHRAPTITGISPGGNTASEFRNLNELIDHQMGRLEKKELQEGEEIVFSGKIEKNSSPQTTQISYEGSIRFLLDSEKLILVFNDCTERDIIAVLETNNDFKDQILASMSHELRTPLNSSLSFLQTVIQNEDVSDEIKSEYLLPAFRSGKLLCHLINDILDYSKIRSEKILLSNETGSLRKTVEYCYDLLKSAFELKGLEYKLDFDETLPLTVKTDHDRVAQIILNLLSNALKFTMKGGVTIEVKCIHFLHAQISIKDTGIGIKPEHIRELFDENSVLTQSHRDGNHTKGVGLGLKVANSISKLIGFDNENGIEVESVYESGSTFSFTIKNLEKSFAIPIRTADTFTRARCDLNDAELGWVETSFSVKDMAVTGSGEIDASQQEIVQSPYTSKPTQFTPLFKNCSPRSKISSREPEEVKISPRKTKKILIVDDDPFNILALNSMLKQIGYSTESANNGKECLDKVVKSSASYSLILMDCQMPIMNGYDAAKALSQKMRQKEIKKIPIIACTAFSAKDKIEECIRSGMEKVIINKPVMIDKLQKICLEYTK